ncbi:MAG: type I-G CRISPR-associated helicase/endonuclease Cas3g [Bacillota bacterium]
MQNESFGDFFLEATGNRPYPYQVRLAGEPEWPDLIDVPTGAGKTAATVLAWAWRRLGFAGQSVADATPRRLVYCLPVRTLVEQTADRTKGFLASLGLLQGGPQAAGPISVYVLLGGEIDDGWVLRPEDDAVIVGTQDQLLSRALNRGYGLSRFRWPAAYGLLNNDALWVLDEIQLASTGLATSVQLAALRREFGTVGEVKTVWMSATADPRWLVTVDNPSQPAGDKIMRLNDEDLGHGDLAKRLQARKILTQSGAAVPLKKADTGAYAHAVADAIVAEHRPGSLTLIVVNTVERAKAIHTAVRARLAPQGRGKRRGTVQELAANQAATPPDQPETLLLHSQFRPYERRIVYSLLTQQVNPNGPGLIAVVTQLVEAGVDVSARTMFSELAPWASMVQRFGRLNRAGEFEEARAFWIDVPDEAASPYDAEDLAAARRNLEALEGKSVGPSSLPAVETKYEPRFVLRRRDAVELFDTSPDLSGNDIDVSRFIRDSKELDVSIFWRALGDAQPRDTLPLPVRDELCTAPVNGLREFLKGANRQGWRWDHLDGRWKRVSPGEVYPGQVILLDTKVGGYSTASGWEPTSKEPVPLPPGVPTEGTSPESTDDEESRGSKCWRTLVDHSQDVAEELDRIIADLGTLEGLQRFVDPLREAARWHDAGKPHPVFQQTLLAGVREEDQTRAASILWAKAVGGARRHKRRHFRHELASALALLSNGGTDLSAYLVAAHHGKVRVAIRSLPGEAVPPGDGLGPETRHALGIWDGELLPPFDLGGGVRTDTPTKLQLGLMELGSNGYGDSWVERILALRDAKELGPFRLAYLEALLGAADKRASAVCHEGGEKEEWIPSTTSR